jgi:Tol biopolymer transport system component
LADGDVAAGPHLLTSTDPTSANQSGKISSTLVGSFAVSPNGSKIAFTTAGTNLCSNCGVASRTQVYLGSYVTLASPVFTMLSSKEPSQADQTNYRGSANSSAGLAWSGNGRYVVFLSAATNFAANTNLPATAQVYRVDLNNLNQAPALVSTLDADTSDQTGLVSTTALNSNLAVSNDGDRVYFSTATQNFLASIAGNNFRRTWERRMTSGELTLVTYLGGDATDAANVFKSTHCDVAAGVSKAAVPRAGFLCQKGSDMPGLSNSKANVFVALMPE